MAMNKRTFVRAGVSMFFAFAICFMQVTAAQAGKLKFHTVELPPFGFYDDAGLNKGALYDIASAITQEAGLEVEHEIVPMARIIDQIKDGRTECTIVTRSPYSETLAKPVAYVNQAVYGVVVVPKDSPLNDLTDLKGQNVAIVRGSHFEHPFDTDSSFERVWTKNDSQAVLMLKRGRVDAVAGPRAGIIFNMEKKGMKPEDYREMTVLVRREFWIHCAEKIITPQFFNRLLTATESLNKNGVTGKIWRQYVPPVPAIDNR